MWQGCLSTKDMQLLKKIGIYTFYFTDVDYAIDRIRKKYNVFICTFPTIENNKIFYVANVKYTLSNSLFMRYIPIKSYWNTNIYEAKRRAIRIAAKWILAHKCKKISIKSAKK